MRSNRLREMFARKEPALAGWLSIDSSYSAEIVASSGCDAVVVDLQHAPIYLDKAVPMLQAISATGAVPLARCAANQLFEINKLLDGGAYGIVCPLINTVQEAQHFVASCRYPPIGLRSYGPTRGLLYGGPDYFEHANDTVLAIGMIETLQALDQLDAICAVPGLDGVLVGPADLGIALGLGPSPRWGEEPMAGTLETIRRAAHRAGCMAGIVCMETAFASAMKCDGWDLVVCGTDSSLLRKTVTEAVNAVRLAMPHRSSGSSK